jgi:hypothetical protein
VGVHGDGPSRPQHLLHVHVTPPVELARPRAYLAPALVAGARVGRVAGAAEGATKASQVGVGDRQTGAATLAKHWASLPHNARPYEGLSLRPAPW